MADKIDNMLAEQFFSYRDNCDIRRALKKMADKYICHYDSFDEEELLLCEMIEKQLRNPYDEHNLAYIMKVVIDCIGEGLSLKTFIDAVAREEE